MTSAIGVRREKAALSSGCKPHPATTPAGSNRSNCGGNEAVEAFGGAVTKYGDGALGAFRHSVVRLWLRALLRRSQCTTLTWERMINLADDWLPRPTILHPWPEARFDVKHPRCEPSARIGLAGICPGALSNDRLYRERGHGTGYLGTGKPKGPATDKPAAYSYRASPLPWKPMSQDGHEATPDHKISRPVPPASTLLTVSAGLGFRLA